MITSSAPPSEARPRPLPVRVFIVNDHALVRQGLRDLFEHEGFQVIGDSGSAVEATRLVPALRPDVAIVDERLPDGTGIEVCRHLRSIAPEVNCLILTGWDDQHGVRAAVLAGASGYLVKRIGDGRDLIKDVSEAASGRSLLGPGVRERVAESLYATAGISWLDAMTFQERNVFALMARGQTNRQIEQEMRIPSETVVRCVSSVVQKLGFSRRSHLASGRPATWSDNASIASDPNTPGDLR